VRDGNPDYQFQRIWEARRLSDGRFITADDMAKELRIFDSSGRHLKTIGGDGEGPGEFRAVWLVGVYRGDSIYAYDYALMRASIFTPDAVFARSVENPIPGSHDLSWAFDDGRFLFTKSVADRPQFPPGLHWITAPAVETSPDGAEVDTLAVLPIRQVLMGSTGRQEAYHMMAEAMRGPWGHGFFWATSDKDEVRFYNRAGELERIVRRGRERQAVTEELKEQYKSGWLDYMAKEQGEDAASEFAPMLDAAVFPEEVPYFGSVLTDPTGYLWVQDYSTPFFLNRTWSVFDPSGQWLGEVQMPEGLRVTDIGEDYVLGITMDDLGVQYIHLYGLDRGGQE
jgi:hypothetical protein